MTKALQKALDLYREPQEWTPTQGLPIRMSDEDRAAAQQMVKLRSSLLCDDWPFMIEAFCAVMRLPIPAEPTVLDPAARAEIVQLLAREVNDLSAASTLLKQADEFLDVIYLAVRGLKSLGLSNTQILAGFTETHASNMTKVLDDGRPLVNDGAIQPHEPIGKILKTHNYVPPDYAAALSLPGETT